MYKYSIHSITWPTLEYIKHIVKHFSHYYLGTCWLYNVFFVGFVFFHVTNDILQILNSNWSLESLFLWSNCSKCGPICHFLVEWWHSLYDMCLLSDMKKTYTHIFNLSIFCYISFPICWFFFYSLIGVFFCMQVINFNMIQLIITFPFLTNNFDVLFKIYLPTLRTWSFCYSFQWKLIVLF